MPEIERTPEYAEWFRRLKDQRARFKILARIDRLTLGNPGKVEPVGGGVSEMKLDYGPGYRVYYRQRGDVVLLLWGGIKDTQPADIAKAKAIAGMWET